MTESSAVATASRTFTQSGLTVQKPVRPQMRGVGGILAGADHRRERALERARCTSPMRISVRLAGQGIATVGAARAGDEAGVAQADHELLQVGPRQLLVVGDLGQADRSVAVVAGELDHEAHAVLAARREVDRARGGEDACARLALPLRAKSDGFRRD